jgi:hypothetical protein
MPELEYRSIRFLLGVAHRFWVLRSEWCQKWCQSVPATPLPLFALIVRNG